jgi:hypothetical protein
MVPPSPTPTPRQLEKHRCIFSCISRRLKTTQILKRRNPLESPWRRRRSWGHRSRRCSEYARPRSGQPPAEPASLPLPESTGGTTEPATIVPDADAGLEAVVREPAQPAEPTPVVEQAQIVEATPSVESTPSVASTPAVEQAQPVEWDEPSTSAPTLDPPEPVPASNAERMALSATRMPSCRP